ncbi:response regulator transcription factor [Paenibacillus piri]|nr:response regulator [Paenibacillus piri]
MRICVVEDESAVRAGIILKLNGLQKNIRVFDVHFGLSALEKISLIRPDLVITDIMMPELDGLEMLRRIKQELPHTKVVLLSGYNEFEYACKGLQLGATDYLLKPLDPAELRRLIAELEEELANRLRTEVHPLLKQLSRQHSIELNHVHSPSSSLWFNETVPKRLLLGEHEEIAGIVATQAEKVVFSFSWSQRPAGVLLECAIGDGGHFFTAEQFASAAAEALEQWETEQFMGHAAGSPLRSEDREARLRHASGTRKTMLKSIREMNAEALKQQLPLFFKLIEPLPLTELRKQCAALMASLDEGLTTKDDIAILEDDKLMYWGSWVTQHESWALLQNEMERFAVGGMKALIVLEQDGQNHSYGIAERAVQLVAHYTDRDISLESVAAQLDIHPVTLSRMFKQHTGENFIHYVTRERMKLAERLLVDSDKKVSDISEQVGYGDHRYFSFLFKKTYGMTPSDYRKTYGVSASH